MKKINLFFFGISKLGLGILNIAYKESGFNIIGAIGKKNKKKHADKYESILVKFCESKNIKYFNSLNKVKKIIKKNSLGIIGGYDGILKDELIKIFDLGIYNIHFGEIPKVRGCNPTIWSILMGNKAAYTLYKINSKIDYGNIVKIEKYKIKSEESSYDIYNKLTKLSLMRFRKFLIAIKKNKIKFIKASLNRKKNNYFRKFLPNNCYISWNWKNEFIYDFSRSLFFPGYKPARTKIGRFDVYLNISKIFNKKFTTYIRPGTILKINRNKIKIKTKYGYVNAETIKVYKNLKVGYCFELYKNKNYPYYINFNFVGKKLKKF